VTEGGDSEVFVIDPDQGMERWLGCRPRVAAEPQPWLIYGSPSGKETLRCSSELCVLGSGLDTIQVQ